MSSTAGSGARPGGTVRALALLAAFLTISILGGVLAAGLLIPAVGATGSMTRSGVEVFDALPQELEIQPLSQQSRILAADGSTIATFYAENRVLVPLDAVAPVMAQAMVAIEDSRFYDHSGVDSRGLLRAALNNVTGGDTQGASTLTQQYVKNVLLEAAVAEGNQQAAQDAIVSQGTEGYARKAREAKLAIALEKQLTKDEILERYLNIALFADSVYGVQAASLYFFGKNAVDLALPEAAMLAGLVQSPGTYNPRTNPEAALDRRNVVLRRMLETGAISEADHAVAAAAPLGAELRPTTNGCEGAGSAAYFCEYVYRVILNDPAFGQTPTARRRLVFTGGLTIRTTLDPRVQQIAKAAVDQSIPPADPSGKAVAAVTVEPGTGRVLAMAQSTTYSQEEGVAGVTKLNYNVDQAFGGGAGNQPGSNFKPVVLAAWLEAGRPLNQVVNAPTRGRDDFSDFTSCARLGTNNGEPYEYANVEGQGGGQMTVLEATFRSVNTAYVDMEKQLDLCAIQQMADRLGVHRAVPTADGSTQIGISPSMALGVNDVSGLSMASAYATFAARGMRCNPIAITEVVDAAGTALPIPPPACEQVISPEVADGVSFALQRTLTEGTARCCSIGRPAAGKTGTTNGLADTWFTGYTPNMATSVWVGDPRGDLGYGMQRIEINGEFYRNVYGSSIAAPTWEAIMRPATEVLGLPPAGFTDPPRAMLGSGRPPPRTRQQDRQDGGDGGGNRRSDENPPPPDEPDSNSGPGSDPDPDPDSGPEPEPEPTGGPGGDG